jgi:hypothetical protein
MANMEQKRGAEPLEPLAETSSIDHASEKKDESGLTTPGEARESIRADGKRELTENECYDLMAYNWPSWKKWMYLTSVAIIQVAMNYNTSVYPSVVPQLTEHFGITEQKARTGQMIYLLFYSFGCELWAPWSEEFGRWPILMLSEIFIIIWTLPQALATNFGSILAGRALVCD